MSALELMNLARACTANIISYFAQVITITFAMVVAIHYFLNQARLGMKVFAFAVYLIGYLMFVGVMLEESNVKSAALRALAAMPQDKLPAPVAQFAGVSGSWLAVTTSTLSNLALWVLVFGVFYLLFFWKKTDSR
jgi:hypothetical protein